METYLNDNMIDFSVYVCSNMQTHFIDCLRNIIEQIIHIDYEQLQIINEKLVTVDHGRRECIL